MYIMRNYCIILSIFLSIVSRLFYNKFMKSISEGQCRQNWRFKSKKSGYSAGILIHFWVKNTDEKHRTKHKDFKARKILVKTNPNKNKKSPAETELLWCWRIPIFPSRRRRSILGTTELNFCVRNGNRWTLCVKHTNLFSVTYCHSISQTRLFVKELYELF